MTVIDDIRIADHVPLESPNTVLSTLPATPTHHAFIANTRQTINNIIQGVDPRLLVLVGPCSIHDPAEALAYANHLKTAINQFSNELFIVMRAYVEKPRTGIGWKGYIYDPDRNGDYAIEKGIVKTRELFRQLTEKKIPIGTEFIDVILPQYTADLVSWGVIGARTVESQLHRQLASGLSMPVGFKNGTDGGIDQAIMAMQSAGIPHHFISIDKHNQACIIKTAGNQQTHIVLRGGRDHTNYDAVCVDRIIKQLSDANVTARVMIDCSHGNSGYDYEKQCIVVDALTGQIQKDPHTILGVMLESNLHAGKQPIDAKPLRNGVSVTDACLSWEMTLPLLEKLANAMRQRKEQ